MCMVLGFLLLTLLVKSLFMKPFSTKNPLHLPPSPPALPIIGHLHLLGPSLYKSLHNLSTKYGPLLYLRTGASRCLVVSSSSMAAEIFKTNDLAFAGRPHFTFIDKLPYGNYGFFMAPYGDYWRFIRKLCMTELLSTQKIEQSHGVRQEEISWFLRKVFACAKKKQVIDVGAELMKLTNNSSCRMMMSTRFSDESDEAVRIRHFVKEALEILAKVWIGDMLGPLRILAFWVYGREAINMNLTFDEFFERMLKQHEESPKIQNEDLMDILLKIYHDDKAEFKITRTHLKAILLDLFGAGTAASAEAMGWTIAELINHPKVFNKVREEIKLVVGDTRLVEESDVPNLPYLQAVVKEGLRLHPPVPIAVRECIQGCKIKDFDVPEKTVVAINVYAIMRDAEIWDNPDDFLPERFLISSGEKDGMEYIPFGGGRRGCPGSKLALSIMHTTIASMVQCFDWKVGGEGDHANKVNMQVGLGFSLPMAHPFVCLPIVHFNPFASSA